MTPRMAEVGFLSPHWDETDARPKHRPPPLIGVSARGDPTMSLMSSDRSWALDLLPDILLGRIGDRRPRVTSVVPRTSRSPYAREAVAVNRSLRSTEPHGQRDQVRVQDRSDNPRHRRLGDLQDAE